MILKDERKWKFVIPVGKKSPKEAQERLSKLIADYKEEIVWNDETGEAIFNKNEDYFIPIKKEVGDDINWDDVLGNAEMPYTKDIWFVNVEEVKPSIWVRIKNKFKKWKRS